MDEDGFVLVEYGIFSQTFQYMIRFFKFITGIILRWYCEMWQIVSLLVWIGICIKLIIYKVNIYPVKWSCTSYGSLRKYLMIMSNIMYKKYLSMSHKKQCYAHSYVSSDSFLMAFEYKTCGIFKVIELPQ